MKTKNNEKVIAVIGATGQQGGGVVRALQASGQFDVRALSRNPGKHRDLADEVVEADLNRPETLKAAFEEAHGVFLVTNPREQGADEYRFGFVGPNCTRKKSRHATGQVFDVGSTECPGSGRLNTTIYPTRTTLAQSNETGTR